MKVIQKSTRRRDIIVGLGSAVLFTPSVLRAQEVETSRRNTSSFLLHKWQDHFDRLGRGILLSDTRTKTLQHWTSDGEMRIYPTSVPLSNELTKRGYTEVVEKRVAPGWGPTPSMRRRNPDWPAYIQGGDPRNPLGSHALYLGWTYYRIHGTQDNRKIGRRSSNGCIGLYNEQIAEVFGRTPLGTQVKLL